MASIGKWNVPSTIVTQFTTALNSLGSNSMSAASSNINNDTNLDMYMDFEVVLTSLSPTAGAFIGIYCLEAVDGSNFPAQNDADLRLTTTQLLVVIPTGTTAGTPQRIAARQVPIPPTKFQLKIDNQTGVALNASGNTVKTIAYNTNLNG